MKPPDSVISGDAQVQAQETAALSRSVFLTERAAFQAERETRPHAKADAGERAIFLEGHAVGRVGRDE